jgi:hypothetical protein
LEGVKLLETKVLDMGLQHLFFLGSAEHIGELMYAFDRDNKGEIRMKDEASVLEVYIHIRCITDAPRRDRNMYGTA